MVQFNELRIGNLVHVGNGIYERVLEILCDSITTETKQGIFDFEGIPITPEILEKAGFRIDPNSKKHAGKVYRCQGVTINLETSRIKYLHQLQNFYFALTGEELQIEL